MPSVQRGQVYRKPSGTWAYRYRDELGKRREVAQFRTRSEAAEALNEVLTRARRGARYRPDTTLSELVGLYLEQHQADPATIAKLRQELKKPVAAFGSVPVGKLLPAEVARWRATLSEGYRRDVMQALRQVLDAAVRWRMVDENAAKLAGPNPKAKRPEVQPFRSWEEIERVAEELAPGSAAIPLFAAGTGLRPEEWIALEWNDIDREDRSVTVRRVFSQGRLKETPKTNRSRRRVPLRRLVVEALEEHPRRIDTRLVFPAARGGYIALTAWRTREWTPALRAAGIDHHRVYDLRHSYATFSLAAGVSLFTLARRMGTSIDQIDKTYGHFAQDAEAYELELLDAYDMARIGHREASENG
jgi:integrase